MKIVINDTYGGFRLSPLAIKEYLKLKGKESYFYDMQIQDGNVVYTKKDNLTGKELFLDCFTKDFGSRFKSKDITTTEYKLYSFAERDIDRTDKDLIRVVEQLKEKANTICSKLKIVEIPDDVDWEIEDYDGAEWVSEKHRTWG